MRASRHHRRARIVSRAAEGDPWRTLAAGQTPDTKMLVPGTLLAARPDYGRSTRLYRVDEGPTAGTGGPPHYANEFIRVTDVLAQHRTTISTSLLRHTLRAWMPAEIVAKLGLKSVRTGAMYMSECGRYYYVVSPRRTWINLATSREEELEVPIKLFPLVTDHATHFEVGSLVEPLDLFGSGNAADPVSDPTTEGGETA